ncbi:hypothetical protein F0170_07235 [Pseudomonas sp. MAFF 730085]|uniref:Uncharacterized protein n=1 Tax=Pseudomonas kitaguniensis TaxID=2607908 RepID=A0A5N7JRD0_9PSED|nr:hypothetical protein [Pseudomonas kitaguniensis]MPQ83793.1 hypothetical protein [Pseudomonas kitaguniensis]
MVNQAQIPDLANLKRVAEAAENTFAELCKSGGDDLAEAWDKAELEFMDAANSTALLALIAHIEALRGLYQMHKQTETREMRRLKCENESLRSKLSEAI